jgi:hypothetical protein
MYDFIVRLNRDRSDVLNIIEPPDRDSQCYVIGYGSSVILGYDAHIKAGISFRVVALLDGDGQRWFVGFEKHIARQTHLFARQTDLVLYLLRHALIDKPRFDRGESNYDAGDGRDDVRHGVLTSGIALAARTFWTRDAEAPASSVPSASYYRLAEQVGILAIIVEAGDERQLQKFRGR